MWKTALGVLVFAVSCGGLQTAGGVPTKMTHLIVQMSGTDIPASSFAAKPKISRFIGGLQIGIAESMKRPILRTEFSAG
jgi:hypothetical protein